MSTLGLRLGVEMDALQVFSGLGLFWRRLICSISPVLQHLFVSLGDTFEWDKEWHQGNLERRVRGKIKKDPERRDWL